MIHITDHKKRLKMSGFISINTSVFENEYCMRQRKNKNSICYRCYGLSMEKAYPRLHKHLVSNTHELIHPLSDESLQNIVKRLRCRDKKFIRFHSVGELNNVDHLLNLYHIAESVPEVIFGLWTKRKDIVSRVEDLPDNVSLIYSNPVIDKPIEWVPEGYNGVFNVMSYAYCMEHRAIPDCTGKCIECLRCYHPDKMTIANELLKSDKVKIIKGVYPPLTFN